MGNVIGNPSKKLAEKCTILSREEQKTMASTYRVASRNSSKITEDDLLVSGKIDAVLLERLWGPEVDPKLLQFLFNFLFRCNGGGGGGGGQACDFNRFAELYVYNVRGTTDERVDYLYACLGKENNEQDLDRSLIEQYCEALTSTFMKQLCSSSRRVALWRDKGFSSAPAHVRALAAAAAAALPSGDCPRHDISKWISQDTLVREFSSCVFLKLFGMSGRGGDEPPARGGAPTVLPEPAGLTAMPSYPAFIDLSHMVWLNHHLPQPHQDRWRFLFSSHVHGESFSTLAGRIIDSGPSLLIIEDKSGHIFGGYAAESWTVRPTFYGREESFLFQLSPVMRIYPSSGFNDHYQYFNQHTKTLPNGIIMGGQLEFPAIFIPAEQFGQGTSSETCTTYRGYQQLSKEKEFRIKSLEVWGVGELPRPNEDSDVRDGSILDKNLDAKAILDMAGKVRHSDGIREESCT